MSVQILCEFCFGEFNDLGIVMVMTIAEMALMNHQNIARAREELALVIFSLAIMVIVFRAFTFVTVIMIVWTIVMRTSVINAVSVLLAVLLMNCCGKVNWFSR